jgi:hypothetical protein
MLGLENLHCNLGNTFIFVVISSSILNSHTCRFCDFHNTVRERQTVAKRIQYKRCRGWFLAEGVWFVLNKEISFRIIRSSAQKLSDVLYTIPLLLYLYSPLAFISNRSSISSVPRKEVECCRILRVFDSVKSNEIHSFTVLVGGPIEQYNSDVHFHTTVLVLLFNTIMMMLGGIMVLQCADR